MADKDRRVAAALNRVGNDVAAAGRDEDAGRLIPGRQSLGDQLHAIMADPRCELTRGLGLRACRTGKEDDPDNKHRISLAERQLLAGCLGDLPCEAMEALEVLLIGLAKVGGTRILP